MSPDEIKMVLAQFRYKPGFRINVRTRRELKEWEPDVALVADVMIPVIDVNPPHRPDHTHTLVMFAHHDLDAMTVQLIQLKIQNAIWTAEKHEMDEWLKWDNCYITDPHPELRG